MAIVTTTEPHGYLPGLYVRFNLNGGFGMEELNGQQFLIGDITPTTFSIPINTTLFTPFATGSANVAQIVNSSPAQVNTDAAQFVPNSSIIISGLDPLQPISVISGNIFNILDVRYGTLLTINVDLSGYPFYTGPGIIRNIQVPQVIPIAEIAETLQNAEKNNLTPIGGFQ